jgi:hypothetical protein
MATQRESGKAADLSPRKVAERIKEEGKSRIERGKSTAADQVESVANALKSAGNELNASPTLASYANQLASSIGQFGTRLREGSVEDLASDMQRAARNNPTLFIAGGLALGILLARLIKASTTEEEPLLVGSDFEESDLGTTTGSTYRTEQSSDAPTVDVSSETYAGGTSGTTPRSFGS